MPSRVTKDPGEDLDWEHGWADELAGDTITDSAWTIPDGLTAGEIDEDFTTTTTTVSLAGGTAGEKYDVINTVQTAGDRTLVRRLRIYCYRK